MRSGALREHCLKSGGPDLAGKANFPESGNEKRTEAKTVVWPVKTMSKRSSDRNL